MAARAGPHTAEAIREAAIDLFFEHGYEATTLRQVAAKVGIQVGSLYNHITSKEDLLLEILTDAMRDFIAAIEASREVSDDPVRRLRAVVCSHVMFHATRAKEVFVGNAELRSLPPQKRKTVVALRDRYEQIIDEIVEDGVRQGVFLVTDRKLVTYAIVAIGSQVAGWVRPRGRRRLEDIANIYSDFVLRALTNPDAPVGMDEPLPPTPPPRRAARRSDGDNRAARRSRS